MGRAVLKRAEKANLVSDPGRVVGLGEKPGWYGVQTTMIFFDRKIPRQKLGQSGKLSGLWREFPVQSPVRNFPRLGPSIAIHKT